MATNDHAIQTAGIEPRHSADDALEQRTFQLLLEGTHGLGDYYALESRLIVLACGRLGLRVGELIHMTGEWLHRRWNMIHIPPHEPCDKGRNGVVCGYCRQLKQQKAAHNEGVTEQEAIAHAWEPKTDAANRAVPYDFHPQTEIVVERYFDRFGRFQTSKSGVNRRLQAAKEQADGLDDVNLYPHALRATAASWHASQGLDALSLQALMGWATLGTAHRYVRRSGDRTKKALQAAHTR